MSEAWESDLSGWYVVEFKNMWPHFNHITKWCEENNLIVTVDWAYSVFQHKVYFKPTQKGLEAFIKFNS